MIRFCEREISCVEYSSLTQEGILSYFLSNHGESIICVYDDFNTMSYLGIITYDLFKQSANIKEAIKTDYVFWNEDIWQNAREYFEHGKSTLTDDGLLPVLNEDYQLVCLAYEDDDANREVRMLRELQATPGALQFTDIFPKYICVRIYGFNELAFLFAKYLEAIGISVKVYGHMWNDWFAGTTYMASDYECIDIYAEGVYREEQVRDCGHLLRTVSPEFECIDNIYESNIQKGIIRDAQGDKIWFIEMLKSKEEIILLGSGQDAQSVYDFAVGQGVAVCCFVNDDKDEQAHRLFGKSILSLQKARCTYKNPIFIDCSLKNSAWGFGQTDYYDYIGYRRNERFFMIKDYIDISVSDLTHALSSCKVILTGDVYICKYLHHYFKTKNISVIGYIDGSISNVKCSETKIESQDAIYLLAAPDFFSSNEINYHEQYELKNSLIKYLKRIGVDNYSDYFSHMTSYMNMYTCNGNKYFRKQLLPKRIVVGSIEGGNGTIFFEGLLDGHPQIFLLPNTFAGSLFWVSIRLATLDSKDILSVFWEIYKETDCDAIFDPVKFNEKMEELLSYDNRFTSQELFIIIYISYMHMRGNDTDIGEVIVFWNAHYLTKKEREECVKWLGTKEVHCDIINLVRNACMTRGFVVKGFISRGWAGTADPIVALKHAYMNGVYNFLDIDNKTYRWSDRLIIQFEELKRNPKETLEKICMEWGIEWSDFLMQVTRKGEKRIYYNGEREISDFDLTPVYNTYDKYFSEYDRLRIMIIQSLWQKKYGYPYVESKQFSKREMQEMFLKKYRFESLIELEEKDLDLDFKKKVQVTVRNQLQKIRMLEIMDGINY